MNMCVRLVRNLA